MKLPGAKSQWTQSSSPWRLLARALGHRSRPQTLAALQVNHLGTVPIEQTPFDWALEIIQSMMIGKALLSRLWARPVGCWCPFIISHISSCFTVRFTFLFAALVATRLCRCLLRSDYMWAVMPWRLRHVISGILAGGIPGFRVVLCCFAHLGVWPCYFVVFPFAIPCQDDVLFWVFCVLLLFGGFAFCFCFLVCCDFVTAYWTMRRSFTSSLLRPLN